MTDIWPIILSVASAIVLLFNAIEKIANAVKVAKAPEDKQNTRITEIEKRLDIVEKAILTDETQIKDARDCNHVLTKGMLALLEHGINGNNIDQMKEAKADVNAYLINH